MATFIFSYIRLMDVKISHISLTREKSFLHMRISIKR